MPIEFEEVSKDVEEPIKNNVYLGEGVTNYGTISNGVTEEIAMMFKTLNNIDYDVNAKPIIRQIGLEFFESNYKAFCNTEEFFERIIYQGSNVEYNTVNIFYHVKLTQQEYSIEFSLKNWDKEKNDFQIKEFIKCEIYERNKKKDDL